jgi:hypothetical protein
MAELEIDRFFKRIGKLHGHFIKHKYVLDSAAFNRTYSVIIL